MPWILISLHTQTGNKEIWLHLEHNKFPMPYTCSLRYTSGLLSWNEFAVLLINMPSQPIILLCVWHNNNWPQVTQQKGHVRANGHSVAQLNARIPGTESMQTEPTICHLVPPENRFHFANHHIIRVFHLTHIMNIFCWWRTMD
jgi:hypothetical protein